MIDLSNKPPNAQLLGSVDHPDPHTLNMDSAVENFDISTSPFAKLTTVRVSLDSNDSSPMGFYFCDCSQLHQGSFCSLHQPCCCSFLPYYSLQSVPWFVCPML
jgi:hypothetical protein